MTDKKRKIIHVDMDAFYASVEQRENPDLKGQPVIVGGRPGGRGVVCAASYEARKFGVRSAMSSQVAHELCPHAVHVRPRISFYAEVSKEIMAIFREFTDLVEPLSLDEAYLDVTENKKGLLCATDVAVAIRKKIKDELSLTASAGVAPNKFIAKIASDLDKPDGLTVIPPHKIEEVLEQLPVRKIPGIGKKTEERLFKLGISATSDLRKKSLEELIELFGKRGGWYFDISRGIDDREVRPERNRKSVSVEDTFDRDLLEEDEISQELRKLADKLEKRVERSGAQGKTFTLKITYSDFKKITRSHTEESPIEGAEAFYQSSLKLLMQSEAGARPIRLLGVGLSNLCKEDEVLPEESFPAQLSLPLSF